MRRAFFVSATIGWALAAISVFGVHLAAAQVVGGSVIGIVTDQQGAALEAGCRRLGHRTPVRDPGHVSGIRRRGQRKTTPALAWRAQRLPAISRRRSRYRTCT